MIPLLLAAGLIVPTSNYTYVEVPQTVQHYCANLIGIPYASDNFSDIEWERFQSCVMMQLENKHLLK